MVANMAPRNQYTGTSVTSPGTAAQVRARRGRGTGEDPPARPGPRGCGWVRRCAANSSVPITHSTIAAPTPAAGYTAVASSVTNAGPTTKMNSSATDSSEKAVCRRPVPASSTLHRARTIDPTDGMVAPARAPDTTTAASGAPISASVMKTTVAAPNTATCGRSTRRWPNRSMSLAICGAPSA